MRRLFSYRLGPVEGTNDQGLTRDDSRVSDRPSTVEPDIDLLSQGEVNVTEDGCLV